LYPIYGKNSKWSEFPNPLNGSVRIIANYRNQWHCDSPVWD